MYLTKEEKQLLEHFEFQSYLEEKLIQFNKGKRYGQIVFLAGGAGSGKGFAIKNFLESDKFKIRDVDEWKQAFIKISQLKKKFPELRNLKLSNPKDVFTLHQFVKDRDVKDKTLNNMLANVNSDRLPNIMFDVTLKDMGDIKDVLPRLEDVGYDPRNIHIVWVLTDFYTAIKNNQGRERVVPSDIVLKTHQGASKTMQEIIKGNIPRGVDGAVHVILNNREETVFWVDPRTGKPLDGKVDKDTGEKIRNLNVKSFTSLELKEPGRPIKKEKEVLQQVYDWIRNNAPGQDLTTKEVAA